MAEDQGAEVSKVKTKKIAKVKPPVAQPDPEFPPEWFGKTAKLIGRDKVRVNHATDEFDVLSLAIHNGIATDEDVSKFILNNAILTALATATKAALSHSKKNVGNSDGTIITRYYADSSTEPPEDPDSRVAYHPAPEEKPSRWAIRSFLVTTICALLDENQRARVLVGVDVRATDTGETSGAVTSGSTMVTFKGQRRDLGSIPISEIEAAESDIMTSKAMNLMRELVCIRKMLQANCEKGIALLCAKVREAEGIACAEQMLRRKEVAEITASSDAEIASLKAARALDVTTTKAAHSRIIDVNRERNILWRSEDIARDNIATAYYEAVNNTLWKLTQQALRQRVLPPAPVVLPIASADLTIEQRLTIELEDAKLEITRLKDDSRAKIVPKPKAHRKAKDPDLHMATETDIKNSVRAHIASTFGGIAGQRGGIATPVSSVATRARKRAGLPEYGLSPSSGAPMTASEIKLMEERELEAARELKRLSRLRELDLCNAESSSDQLVEVVEALSRLLTSVGATIDDVASRRTSILNHMRSLSMHSRSITSLIRDHPYLLSLARRMNHERRPVVVMAPMRALINVAATNLQAIKNVEAITLESVGGVYNVMSLEEAAASAAGRAEEAWVPDTAVHVPFDHESAAFSTPKIAPPVVDRSAPKLLTCATLHRHIVALATSSTHGDGDDSDIESEE